MSKVTIGQLVQFQKNSAEWFGQDPQTGQFKNKQNAESPLGECIMRVMPQVEEYLKEWMKLGIDYNKEVKTCKAEYAEKVIVRENSSMPNMVSSDYEYTGTQLKERNRVIDALWDKLTSDRAVIEQAEVEVGVDYVKNVPHPSILPPVFIASFRGIVIDPEFDPNKKSLTIHKS